MHRYLKTILAIVCLVYAAPSMAQQPLKFRDSTIRGPQTFAMIVGISKYKYIRPLSYADRDAELFRDFLKSPGGGNVKPENIFCLLNEQAVNQNFWGKGFQWLKSKDLKRGDKLFIYLAGHGDAIDGDQFFFLGYDCNPQGDKNNYLVSGAIQLFNLKKKIANETSKGVEVVFIMDACRTQELPGGTEGQNFLSTAISEKKAGEIIMLATGAGQASLEDATIGNGHGLFTYYLVDGLNGLADSISQDQKISFREIQAYVSKYVPIIALQQFRRKQDPFFCCLENNDKVISAVDTSYLKNWLKTRRRGPGNSFTGNRYLPPIESYADTLLVQTYDRFNTAVKRNNLNTAEDYYRQLQAKFPNNPYTLDAKSTLAVEWMNVAQKLVDEYLSCGSASSRTKEQWTEAATNLEKSIPLFREDDADFANSLLGRLFLLKSGSNNASIEQSLLFAHNARLVDPNGAYIMNQLARLHMQNNNRDSALYYAQRATTIAPKWACAFATLAMAREMLGSSNISDPVKPNKPGKPFNTFQLGGTLGGGTHNSDVTPVESRANDTIRFLGSDARNLFYLGLVGQVNINDRFSIRPAVRVSMEESRLDFSRRGPTGVFVPETVVLKSTSVSVPLPFQLKLSKKNVAPYIAAGPIFSFVLQKDDVNSSKVPLSSFEMLGDAGIGVDIGLNKLVLSPELKYYMGVTDANETANTGYSNVITSMKRKGFTFSLTFRRK